MEGSTKIMLGLLLAGVLLGSVLQTFRFFPNTLDKDFDIFASKTTLTMIGILLSFFLMMFFLRLRHTREGFQDDATVSKAPETMVAKWKDISAKGNLTGVCELYNYMFDTIKSYEKGAPPDELTDEQAKESTRKLFRDTITNNSFVNPSQVIFSCSQFQAIQDAPDVDTLLIRIQLIPNDFLKRAYDTATACRKLLRDQLVEVEQELKIVDPKTGTNVKQDSKNIIYPLEPFVNPSVGICSPEIVEERRKFLRETKLTEKEQQCLLPEEVPLDSKEEILQTKFTKLLDGIGEDRLKELPAIVQQANRFRQKLEGYKKKAEEGGLVLGVQDDTKSPTEPKSGECSREEHERKNDQRIASGFEAIPFVPCPVGAGGATF